MNRKLLDALWRAGLDCLSPRLALRALVPWLASAMLALTLGWWLWELTLDAVHAGLYEAGLNEAAGGWLDSVGASHLRVAVVPLIVVALASPLLAMLALVMVALLLQPACIEHVAARRVAVARRPASRAWPVRAASALGWCTVATALLLASLPLWLLPPLGLVLPALVLGWLAWRLLGFEMLREGDDPPNAARLAALRTPLRAIGVGAGLASGAASWLWWSSAKVLVYAPLLPPALMLWQCLAFGFAALWSAHLVQGARETNAGGVAKAEAIGVESPA